MSHSFILSSDFARYFIQGSGGLMIYDRSTLRQRNLKTEVSLWKHIKFFPSEFKNARITDHFRFVFEENSGKEIT